MEMVRLFRAHRSKSGKIKNPAMPESYYSTNLRMMEEGKIKNKLEADLMREICQENIEEGELIEQLLMLQKSKSLMQRRRGLKTEIESRLEEFVNKKKS